MSTELLRCRHGVCTLRRVRSRYATYSAPGIAGIEWANGGTTSDLVVGWDVATRRRVAIKAFAADIPQGRVDHETVVHASVGALDGVVGLHRRLTIRVGDEDRPALQMDECDGGSLARRFERSGPLDVEIVCRWGEALATALASIHVAGVWHRDITPQHVLIHGSTVRWCDFGAAAIDGQVADPAMCRMLTPAFAAPERLADPSELGGGPADVWSLGAVLAASLIGRPPFGTPLDGGWDAFRARRRRSPLAGIDMPHTKGVIDALRCAMAPEPIDRPVAAELATMFRELADAPTFQTNRELLDRGVWFQ